MEQKAEKIKFDINYISFSNPFIVIHNTNNNSVTQKNENPSNISPFKCTICGKTFKYKCY